MPDLVNVKYKQTGKSKKTNKMGMREMQERAYEARSAQYLLIKAPPASGKSRALMFIGLDKLREQSLKKVIVAVPERSIGSSFAPTKLKKFGFYEDWNPNPKYNLCTPGSEKSKIDAFMKFMNSNEEILICTHATLRNVFDALDEKVFNNTVIAIDEFHHVSAEGTNRLGSVLNSIMTKSTAHVVAMTGSYFRGDSIPILLPEIEAQFIKVKYDYYEQLNGYEYLKSLGIGYHFYQRKYTSAIHEVLDENKKTIVHIPSVNSGESTKEKYEEVGKIIETIGDLEYQDPETGVLYVKSDKTGKLIKIADLVNDDQKARDKIQNYLRNINSADDIDIIIALGMAKEGFDWPYCEQALTVGYRGSLTEIIQIIGRATRDSDNKTHAQFTNLIAQPDAEDDEVKISVNNMLKAITASLLMEQVLAPNFKFKAKYDDDENEYEEGNDKTNQVNEDENTIHIRGFKEPSTAKVSQIIESDLNDLKARILQDNDMLKAMPSESLEPEVINQVLIPKIIKETYPELSDEEVEEVRQHIVVDSVIKNGTIEEQGNRKFIKMADTFVNIDDIHIDLIDSINPFQKAFEILSKSVTTKVLRTIQETIDASRIQMTEEEAIIQWPKIKAWVQKTGKNPDIKSLDPKEKRMAEAVIFIKELKRKRSKNA
jgi:superfamily II DNA or RNA helicase